MHVQQLHLEEFRVYRELDLDLTSAGLRIVGPNGSGKSSLLEAVALLSTARSQRSGSDRELIRWGSGQDYGFPPYARCRGLSHSDGHDTSLEMVLEGEAVTEDEAVQEAVGAIRKRCMIDGRPVRTLEFVGRLRSVSFSPEDVALVSGPPADRRRFIDIAISQLDRRYLKALSRYGRVMSQRNGLLKSFSRDGVSPSSVQARSQLLFWDDQLIDAGCIIVARRRELIEQLSTLAAGRYEELTGGMVLGATYRSTVLEAEVQTVSIPSVSEEEEFPGELDVRDRFRAGLERRRVDEFRRGVTLVGPHRDDVALSMDGVDLATYGSRGQQRLGILALKLAEADLMVQVGGEAPVLLLDDVLSELDPGRSRLLIDTVARYNAQVLVTATDEAALQAPVLRDLPLLHAGAGTLR